MTFARVHADALGESLGDVRDDPLALVLTDDPKRDLVAFDIAITRDMGTKSGRGKGSFVQSTMSQVSAFYGDVLQDIQPWRPKAPRLKEESQQRTEPESVPPRSEIVIPPSSPFYRWLEDD